MINGPVYSYNLISLAESAAMITGKPFNDAGADYLNTYLRISLISSADPIPVNQAALIITNAIFFSTLAEMALTGK